MSRSDTLRRLRQVQRLCLVAIQRRPTARAVQI